jgi:hypothetical protein
MTLGEKRVRMIFNPSASDRASDIKARAAELINLCEEASEAHGSGRA